MRPPDALSPPSPRLRGEGHGGAVLPARGEGQPQTPSPASAPHPNPLPAEAGRGDRSAFATTGARASDGTIWRNGAFHRDTWAKAGVDGPLPGGPLIVPKKRWLAERDGLARRTAPLGLLIGAGESVDDIAGDLARFAIIALDFPKFADGRAFSTARLLREKYGYAGELRAVGNVLADPFPFMRRVGFDSFEVANGPTRRALVEGRIPEVTLHYQPTGAAEPPAGTRPWLRRSPT